MKKRIFLSLILTTLLIFNTVGQAAILKLNYDGSVHNYSGPILKLKINGEIVNTETPPIIINNRSLVPARAVFEKLGATVNWNSNEKKVTVTFADKLVELTINSSNAYVNKKLVNLDVPAKIINAKTMVPTRFVSENLNMKVDWISEQNLVAISYNNTTPNSLLNLSVNSKSGREEVSVLTENSQQYKISSLKDPDRIIVDFPNTLNKLDNKQIDVNGTFLKTIRSSQYSENTARIVFDVNENSTCNVSKSDNRLVFSILKGDSTTIADNTSSDSTTNRGDIDRGTVTVEPTPVPGSIPSGITLKHDTLGDKEKVYIDVPNIVSYNAFRQTGPERLVIDINGITASDEVQKLDIQSSFVNSVRYSKLTSNSVRVVLDLPSQLQYTVQKSDTGLVVQLVSPTYRNITYNNSSDRVNIILKDILLTEGGQTINKFYTENFDKANKKYILTFSSSLGDVGVGVLKINDSFIDNVEIERDDASNQTRLIFNLKGEFIFNIISRSEEHDTAITILRSYKITDKLVVIDAGHGGSEPGAVYDGLLEKDVNLDISKRLNTLLKNNGVKTYMIRESDTFVGLYERTSIANNMNASLFMSIHNNAFLSEYKGTETLYFPSVQASSSISGKEFAQIIQDKLVSKLTTVNRGIVERPNLVVLKATNMPAVLTEIAFLTNDQDRANLRNDQFKQAVAQALCDGIIDVLRRIPN